jgi:hypothetical protein
MDKGGQAVILCARGAELRRAMFAASRQLTPADGTAGYCRYLAGIDRETEARRSAVEALKAHYAECDICHLRPSPQFDIME